MFIVVVDKNWKQSKCFSTGKWINKVWYRHVMKYYSAVKKRYTIDILNMDESQNSYMLSKRCEVHTE